MRDSSYGTALHISAMKDRFSLTQTLISHGAKLSQQNGLQYTPLHLNINSHSKSSIAPLLIYHGVDASGFDKFNYTVLAAIIRNMRFDCETLAKLLVYAGYDLKHDIWLLPPKDESSDNFTESDSKTENNIENENKQRSNSESSESDSSAILPIECPSVPIPAGRIAYLCDWLREKQCNALTLTELCRIVLRHYLSELTEGRSIVASIILLPLPTAIKDYVGLRDLMCVENLHQ